LRLGDVDHRAGDRGAVRVRRQPKRRLGEGDPRRVALEAIFGLPDGDVAHPERRALDDVALGQGRLHPLFLRAIAAN
jgi:hypothetical protein